MGMGKIKISLLFVAITLLFVQGCSQKTITVTGEQMLYIQFKAIEAMEPVLNNITDIYSDYLAFNKSDEEFLKDIENLKYQYKQIDNNYTELNKRYVLAGDTDQRILDAIKCITNARQAVWNILNNSVNNGKALSRVELLQLYLEQGNVIKNNMEKFTNILNTFYSQDSESEGTELENK